MKDEEYYRQQIKGLIFILKDAGEKEVMISRKYVEEKLRLVLSEEGINFHPEIERVLKENRLSNEKN